MSFNEAMNIILPPQNGLSPHVTGNYGENRSNGPHGRIDFNYADGSGGIELSNLNDIH